MWKKEFTPYFERVDIKSHKPSHRLLEIRHLLLSTVVKDVSLRLFTSVDIDSMRLVK